MEFRGVFTAMVTPFVNDQLDEAGLRHNIRRQLEAAVAGLVLLGTTGEAATLTREEKRRVLEIGVEEAKGKALLIAGTGSNSTQVALEQTREAQEIGCDAALIVTPYYNKPTQEGIFRHFEVLNSVGIPLLAYNIQGRTGVNIETPTLLRLASLPHLIGVKEASGNLNQVADVLHALSEHFHVLSGDDGLTLPMIALGACGVISVVSNLFPKEMVALVTSCLEGNFSEARKWHKHLLPFFRLAFIEVNPLPIKEAMNHMGLPAGACRLPLCAMQSDTKTQLLEFFCKK